MSYITGARVWWGQPGPDLWKPSLLLTAAPVSRVKRWIDGNPWASALPLVTYTRAQERSVNARPVVIGPKGSDWPCWIEGAPPDHPAPVIAADLTEYLLATIDSAAWCASHLEHPEGHAPWELMADASAGPLAIGAALHVGRAAAVAATEPGVLTAGLAALFGVVVAGKSIVDSGQHLILGAGQDARKVH